MERTFTIQLPEALANQAEQLGLLSRERVITWLQTEVNRHTPVTGDEPAADEQTRHESLARLYEAAVKLRAIESGLTEAEIAEGIRDALSESRT